jgi:hypothetical protein
MIAMKIAMERLPMSTILFKPADKHLPLSLLAETWLLNNGGGGYCYPVTEEAAGKTFNKLYFVKFKDREFFMKTIREDLDKHKDRPFLIFMGNDGTPLCFNTIQPFSIYPEIAFATVGEITTPLTKKEKARKRLGFEPTDAYLLNEIFQRWYKRNKDFMDRPVFTRRIKEIMNHSKAVFLASDGNFTIVNEQLGTWNKDIWVARSSPDLRLVTTTGSRRYNYLKRNHENGVWDTTQRAYVFPSAEDEYYQSAAELDAKPTCERTTYTKAPTTPAATTTKDYKPDPAIEAEYQRISRLRKQLIDSPQYQAALTKLKFEDYMLDNYACLMDIKTYHRLGPIRQDHMMANFIHRSEFYRDGLVKRMLAPIEKSKPSEGSTPAGASETEANPANIRPWYDRLIAPTK